MVEGKCRTIAEPRSVQPDAEETLRNNNRQNSYKHMVIFSSGVPAAQFLEMRTEMKAACFVAVACTRQN